ncbi:hypothetical protein FRACYDRAFT_234999 [Fragilariopsis cylindrus CCMP1102]|uniref:Uncharacterized protein n=1 Tax=Fragilariopsis cylindrus CCMP1102 TaxID=635003 RepID=A0A1E7FTE8_9STRA|nr:hypothetical protein FRACYDRAFT_234999 [Fragilariopsis cylindrus CCMP1102]|eukprot:OEU21375.1 hypothetical protein FRACYDRAFT_234999 [Fragilariopsis cylindrus CCMP1102]
MIHNKKKIPMPCNYSSVVAMMTIIVVSFSLLSKASSSSVSSLDKADAIIFTQMSPTFSGLDLGEEWSILNAEMKAHNYQLMILVADPKKWSLLTIGMKKGNATATTKDIFSSDAAKVLAQQEKEALDITAGGTTTLNALSNIAIITNYELYPIVKEMYDVAGSGNAGNDLMAHISGSSYSVPKVIDFMLRALYPTKPVVRFDSDVLVNTMSTPESFQTTQLVSVVQRTTSLFRSATDNVIDGGNISSSSEMFVFSSRYVSPMKMESLNGLDWTNSYSTRPNPALYWDKLLTEYGSNESAAIYTNDFKETKTSIQAIENQYYTNQEQIHNVSKTQASEALFLAATSDDAMVRFYSRLSPYVPLQSNDLSCLQNAVISGAGMVLSPRYAATHAPRLNFGVYNAKTMDGITLDSTEEAIANAATLGAEEWGAITDDGKLYPNNMWIDDQITANYMMLKLGANDQVLSDPNTEVYITKTRSAPENPLWYTLAIYMPTLLSGFLLNAALKLTGEVSDIDNDIAASVFEEFRAIFPTGSIGELYCEFVTIEDVTGALRKAYEEEIYWETVLSPDWAAMFSDEEFLSRIRLIVDGYVASSDEINVKPSSASQYYTSTLFFAIIFIVGAWMFV